jgi:heme exporter protein D
MPTVRTSRWRAGPTSFGPLGRMLSTAGVVALFPWWGLGGNPFFLWSLMGWLGMAGIVLRSVWKRERIVDPVPTRIERLRARHPFLAREIRLTGTALTVVLVLAVGGAAAAWLSFDTGFRFLAVVIVMCAGLGVFLAISNDL